MKMKVSNSSEENDKQKKDRRPRTRSKKHDTSHIVSASYSRLQDSRPGYHKARVVHAIYSSTERVYAFICYPCLVCFWATVRSWFGGLCTQPVLEITGPGFSTRSSPQAAVVTKFRGAVYALEKTWGQHKIIVDVGEGGRGRRGPPLSSRTTTTCTRAVFGHGAQLAE